MNLAVYELFSIQYIFVYQASTNYKEQKYLFYSVYLEQ